MPFLGRFPLIVITIGAALAGQLVLPASPVAGIAVLGVALAALLVERWWYPALLKESWLSMVLLGILGLANLGNPLGWFFLTAAAILAGTGLRAQWIVRRMEALYQEAMARMAREAGAALPEPGRLPPAAPPVAWTAVARGILFGLLAAGAGAFLWLALHKGTGWRLEWVAWPLGILVGRAVLSGAGRGGRPAQVSAVALTALGALGGRYLILRELLLTPALGEWQILQAVAEAALRFPLRVVGLWGLIFLILAMHTAWRQTADET